jgi:P27 family predicted phage terminase small subunit
MHGPKPDLTPIESEFRPVELPNPPAGLNLVARREWKRLARILHDRALLGPDMYAVLECYCRLYAMVKAAGELVDRDGVILEDGRPNPAVGIVRTGSAELRLLSSELGLSPRRRTIRQRPLPPATAEWPDGLLA